MFHTKMTLSSPCPQTSCGRRNEFNASSSSVFLVFMHPSAQSCVLNPCWRTHTWMLLCCGPVWSMARCWFAGWGSKTLTSPSAPHIKGSWDHFIPVHPLWCSLRSLFNPSSSLRWDWATPKSFLISSLTAPSRAHCRFLLLQGAGGPDWTYLYVSVEHRGLLFIPLL